MHLRVLGLVGLLAASCAALLVAQQERERVQFRSGVDLVQLDVVVLDGKRQPVSGLTAADFTVLDNGVDAPIRAFTPVELAKARTSDAAVASDLPAEVVTNQVGEEEGRLVIILMDRSIPPNDPVVHARKIAKAAVDALGPHDLAAVISTDNNAVQGLAVQNLTADRTRLLRAITAMDPSTGMSTEAAAIMNKWGYALDQYNDGRCLCGLCVPETITRVAEAVQRTPRRRKVLFFIGSNMVWQQAATVGAASASPGCELRLKDARNAMFAAIDRANLTVHAIDPQGLVNNAAAAHAGSPPKPAASAAGALRVNSGSALSDRANLTVLPDRTGGRTVVGRNNPEETVPDIFRETESYYVIGIERAISARRDGTRSVEVKVKRRGLRVLAQRQYVGLSDQPGASAPLTMGRAPASVGDALNQLMPSGTVPLALAMTAFANPDNVMRPIVRLNIDAGAFAPADGAAIPLDVHVVALDLTGKPVASAKQTSTIAAKRAADSAPIDVNVQSQLELPPGEYGVRVAVSDPATGKIASVFSDVTVPEFHAELLSLSGVSVETTNVVSKAVSPSTRRTFRRNEQVRVALQIYQGTGRADMLMPVTMRVRILNDKGAAVRDESLPFAESSFTSRRATCTITLPLANLTPGGYVLDLTASADRRDPVSRRFRFVVE
jgi:VWFA-related protein